jgi:hypothetical protein
MNYKITVTYSPPPIPDTDVVFYFPNGIDTLIDHYFSPTELNNATLNYAISNIRQTEQKLSDPYFSSFINIPNKKECLELVRNFSTILDRKYGTSDEYVRKCIRLVCTKTDEYIPINEKQINEKYIIDNSRHPPPVNEDSRHNSHWCSMF